jgi:hypothetical protein
MKSQDDYLSIVLTMLNGEKFNKKKFRSLFFQAGSILGMFVVGPIVGLARTRSLSGLKNGAIKVCELF